MSNSVFGNYTQPEDFRVYGLEKIQPAYAQFQGKMYAGMLPMDHDGRTGMTQFWLFQPDTQLVPDSMVLWLNGGPGCSSFNCGVMMEHSPVTQPLHAAGYCCLKASPQLDYNEHAWTRATTMLYVEHPIGTGFSYGHPEPDNETEASSDLDQFLQNFFRIFTQFQSYQFYVIGESYAGMFVPSVARYIHNANQAAGDTTTRIPIALAGAAIGNGWIDATVQGPATIDYSWWHGLIDQPTRDALHHIWKRCMTIDPEDQDPATHPDVMAHLNLPPPFHPFNVQDDCGIMWGILQAAGNPNAYDVTTWDPNVDQITFTSEAFFNMPEVKEALHVTNKDHVWHGCQAGSGRRRLALHKQRQLYMNQDRPISVVPYIEDLLNAHIPVLVYNGDRDMTTNMVGTELCLNQMKAWHGHDKWLDAPRGLWNVNNYPGGWAKEYDYLTYVVVYNSGHMVPYNVPDSAFDLLTRFLTKKSFVDAEAPQIRVPAAWKQEKKDNKKKKHHHNKDKKEEIDAEDDDNNDDNDDDDNVADINNDNDEDNDDQDEDNDEDDNNDNDDDNNNDDDEEPEEEEDTQKRHHRHDDKKKKAKKHGDNGRHHHHHHYNNNDETPELLGATNTLAIGSSSSNNPFMMHQHQDGIVIILLAMVVGFAMGLLFAKKSSGSSRNSNNRSRHEYQSIPNVAAAHEASPASEENTTILA